LQQPAEADIQLSACELPSSTHWKWSNIFDTGNLNWEEMVVILLK